MKRIRKMLCILLLLCLPVLLINGGLTAFAQTETDSSALKAALAAAQSLEAADYSAESYASLDMLVQQYQPIADEMTSQAEIDNATASLLEALNALRAYVRLTVSANRENVQPAVTYDSNIPGSSDNLLLAGTSVTVTAPELPGNMFVGWRDTVSKRILYDSAETTFTLAVNTSLEALYIREDCSLLVFMTEGGCILEIIEKTPAEWAAMSSLDTLLPRVPYSYGYTNGRWDIPDDALARLAEGEPQYIIPVYDDADAFLPAPSTTGEEIQLELHYRNDADASVGSFMMNSSIPYTVDVQSVGMLFYYKKAAQFDPTQFYVNINNKMLTSQYDTRHEEMYITNMRKMTARYNWAARGYVTYLENGELKTVYSNQVNIVNTEDIHDIRTAEAVAPTCTEAGLTEGSYCFICGTVYEEQQALPATGHQYSTIVIPPTCTENGSIVSTCENCGDSVTEGPALDPTTGEYTHPELLATGHDYRLSRITEPATLDSTGLAEYACARCGDIVTQPDYVATGDCGADVHYTFDHRTGALTLSGSGPMEEYTLSTDSPFANRENIRTLTVENGVTEISPTAFYKCSGLESVTLADSVSAIGNRAFYQCDSIQSVSFGNSLETIGYHAFYQNTSLQALAFPASLRSIAEYAFSGCSNLAAVVMQNGLQMIDRYAFYRCTSLTEIVLPNTVSSVGIDAFAECTALQTAVLSSAMPRVEEAVFSGCTSLTHVTLPNSIYYIGKMAFLGCGTLCNVSLPAHLNTIGTAAFYGCESLGEITLPSSLRTVESEAFRGCTTLITSLPNGITTIDSGAFRECAALVSITLPDTLDTVSNSLFYGCTGLTTLSIPDNITTIENNALYGCSSLTAIHIPASVQQIGQNVFGGCGSVTTISVDSGNTVYDSRNNCNAIMETANNKLIFGSSNTVLPQGTTAIADHAFDGSSLNGALAIPDSVTAIGDYAFYNCGGLTGITISDSVTNIGKYALSGCTGLTQITLPQGLTAISEGLLSGCTGVISVTVPDSVSTIALRAFSDCSSLTTVNLPDNITALPSYVFSNCTSLSSLTLPASLKTIGSRAFNNCIALTAIEIPSGTSSVENYSFYGCSALEVIDLPNTVTKIGTQAFRYCTSLHDIYIRNLGCKIASGATTIPEQTVIHGYLSSTARTYAVNNNRTFEQLS